MFSKGSELQQGCCLSIIIQGMIGLCFTYQMKVGNNKQYKCNGCLKVVNGQPYHLLIHLSRLGKRNAVRVAACGGRLWPNILSRVLLLCEEEDKQTCLEEANKKLCVEKSISYSVIGKFPSLYFSCHIVNKLFFLFR